MSTAIFDNFQAPNNQPANFPYGLRIGEGGTGGINDIGAPGGPGFGVGICPGPLPSGMTPLDGHTDPTHHNYGNYINEDGSVMVWIPAFFYKWGTGTNGLGLNRVSIKPFHAYSRVADAASDGYALHRAFYDGGGPQLGVFVDKYQCSNNNGIASSIKNASPLAAHSSADSPFSGLSGSPANNLSGAIDAAKTRGDAFFCISRFIFAALAMLSYAHGQESQSTTWCAWHHTTHNFPKGCNNNALRDTNDSDVIYQDSGYENKGLTGSANLFARTTHNGQFSGVADLNGNVWEATPGLTALGETLYILKTSARMRDLTSGATIDTDLWGAAGVAENYDELGSSYQAWNEEGEDRTILYGSIEGQVFSSATSGLAWNWAGAGGLLTTGYGGTNAFGNDRFSDYTTEHMCPASGGTWGNGSRAGVWTLLLSPSRSHSNAAYGFRSALFL